MTATEFAHDINDVPIEKKVVAQIGEDYVSHIVPYMGPCLSRLNRRLWSRLASWMQGAYGLTVN